MAESREAPFGHEPPDVATRRVVGITLLLGGVVAVALVAVWLSLRYWIMPDYAQLQTQSGLLPPPPRLQPRDPHRDLEQLRAEKAALLSGYAWVDPSHDYARIPIRRAMRIYVQEHQRMAEPATGHQGPESGKRGPATGRRGEAGAPAAAASTGRQP